MENFIVSARKYRPSSFQTVVGQQSITVTLKNAIKNAHLAHAYLFCGPRGVGKTSCARIFAKTINCSNVGSDFEACNECESCLSFNENRSYNIHELDAASNNSVDDIRTLIDQVRIPPQIGKYSVYIIDEVHMLSQQAFNAFLKTLEEPPAHAIFVLATTEKHKIIPTILSRCQIFDFSRIKVGDAVSHLKHIANTENINIDEEALNVIAQKADGAMRDALSIFDQIVSFSGKDISFENVIQNLNVLDYDYYFKMVDAFLQGKVTDVLILFNEIVEKGFDGHHFVAGLSSHIRDILVGKDAATLQLLEVSDSVKEKYTQQAKKCEVDFLYDALGILNECDIHYKSSQNQRLLIELTLIQLSQIIESKKKGLRLNLKSKKLLKIFVDGESIGSVKQVVTAVKASAQSTEVVSDPNNGYKAREKKDVVTISSSKSNFAPSVSIKQALKKGIPRNTPISKPKDKPATNGVEEVITGKEPITKEKIEAKLKEFIVSRGRSERVKLALGVIKPEVNGETDVVFQVSNPLQEDDVNSAVNEVKNYLRRELNNSNIEITVKITKAKLSKKVYTETDRFNYLCEKNPALGLLKQKLSLDFE
ncbi:DNA polymerase III subunit gamma/tau [Labilibaculum sp. DW002]|uniref:DNA polymerase III subunit gamma/tau n=1 Tax=Paralabilibaculum antarcticum TaxID=2912572 RepID=A0ABT5VQP3_9BACT|nr:DNA polymerase III subunit gamma/tau [Labilibaculum sp. DW002]MDE5416594.1 DNA polymerase III subunit gamma/tau [Labilibaculum sp. DW002]